MNLHQFPCIFGILSLALGPATFSYGQPTDDHISIEGRHARIFCLDDAGQAEVPNPVASSSCGEMTSMQYEESFIDLGCGQEGFTGYFEPSNWTVSTIYGDGGVDVTGAPNSLLVEGANKALVGIQSGAATRMQIPVPADGMIAFNWSNIGGSNLLTSDFHFTINGRPVDQTGESGRCRQPVRQGDQFVLTFSTATPVTLEIEGFRLLSPIESVLVRDWTATDDQGHSAQFRQFISIEQPNITDITFPAMQSADATAPAISPEQTGYPYIDRDGDPETTADRYFIRRSTCSLRVEYSDEIQQAEGFCILYRHWLITDACGKNTMKETQIIKLLGGSSFPGDCPGNLLPGTTPREEHEATPENSSSPFSLKGVEQKGEFPMSL